MALKLPHRSFLSSRESVRPPSHCQYRESISHNRLFQYWITHRQGFRSKNRSSDHYKCIISSRRPVSMKHRSRSFQGKFPNSIRLSSANDNVIVHGIPRASSRSELEKTSVQVEQPSEGEDISSRLVQSLHDGARSIELALTEYSSSIKSSWFSKAWIGVDKNAWTRTISYQAAVYCLLQAAVEIASRGDGGDRELNSFVQRSLMRLSVPLETVIRDELSSKEASAYEWFWSQQYPTVVSSFVNLLEKEPQVHNASATCRNGSISNPSLLILSLSCIAAVNKLGLTKISCPQFFSGLPDVTGRLMNMLVDFIPIWKAYSSMKDIGLWREFLLHFGPRASSCRVKNDQGFEEISFWVDLVQKQVQRGIDREKIWSRLTTSESIEVLEKDLAIFGFFIALGRSTKSFLSKNGFADVDEQIESFISYLIGGSALYYPQLASISSYQLYVEVVCEELDWLPFYQTKLSGFKQNQEDKGQIITLVLDSCSHWMETFIKYSSWVENPSNIKAARFLSKGHNKLEECRRELGIRRIEVNEYVGGRSDDPGPTTSSSMERELDSFDKALESVEEAINRLEGLLQELHLSNSGHGKEHLKAACSDLERLRKLKKEAEFLEASFRAKAASLEEEGKVYNDLVPNGSPSSDGDGKPQGFWSFLAWSSNRKTFNAGGERIEDIVDSEDADLNEIHRFELLRNELIELEKRVQGNTDGSQDEEVPNERMAKKGTTTEKKMEGNLLVKSIDKLKKTSTDVWQGTQLLAIDVAAATELLKRGMSGDELTEKEKKAIQRTCTDVASVVPIGILMLLPVTAVGHAAMLAAIQRYVPALIPSTYGAERLDLLRQLEKVKEMATTEANSEENQETRLPS